MAAPVTRDEEVELEVESLAYGGNGVARLDGYVVFVRRGLPGDRVRARVTKVKRSHAEALATEVLRPGPQRVEAPCEHFPACGGCRFQDLAYDAQLEQKQAQVRDALQRLAGIAEPPLEEILPCEPEIFHYRNKLEYSVPRTPSGPEPGYFVDVVRKFPQVQSVHWSINDTPSEVTNLPTKLLSGEEWIEEELGGLRFRVRPNAFLQTNTAMAEKLYALAREAAQLSGNETVWDLYCGIGTIGLSLAGDEITVWGIEISEESVACALENAELNGVTNAAFFAGNVGQVVEELLERS